VKRKTKRGREELESQAKKTRRESLLCYGCSYSKEERFLRQVFSQKGFLGVSGQKRPDRFANPV
jgi:hypothetical protein